MHRKSLTQWEIVALLRHLTHMQREGIPLYTVCNQYEPKIHIWGMNVIMNSNILIKWSWQIFGTFETLRFFTL